MGAVFRDILSRRRPALGGQRRTKEARRDINQGQGPQSSLPSWDARPALPLVVG
jgi:hypothetical protein